MNVMKKAWEIAREGQGKFGGKVREYFAEALKIAWVLIKQKTEKFVTELDFGRKYWIAKVTGTHPTYKMEREFLTENYIEDGQRVFELSDGLYHGKFSNSPHYFLVENGFARRVEQDEALEIAEVM